MSAAVDREALLKVLLETGVRQDVAELQAERDRLREQVDAVRALHFDDGSGWCNHDGYTWPCPTIRTLDRIEAAQ